MENRYKFISPADDYIDEILALELICFQGDPWSRGMFEELIKNDNCIISAVYDMQVSKIIGYCVIYTAADQADLANIAISPEYRGQGLGRALAEYTCAKARERGAFEVFLEVRGSNLAARSLYNSMDFVEIGKRRNYYANPREDAVIMMRNLIEVDLDK